MIAIADCFPEGIDDAGTKRCLVSLRPRTTLPGDSIPVQVVNSHTLALGRFAPANLKKDANGFDLPIALGLLLASGQVAFDRPGNYAIVGELALTWTPFNHIPNIISDLFEVPPEDFLYVGTDKELRNRLQQQEHKMWRIDLSPYAELGYLVRIAFWYLDTPERQNAEAFLINTLHPRYNIEYPRPWEPWNLQTPDDEDIDPEDCPNRDTVRQG